MSSYGGSQGLYFGHIYGAGGHSFDRMLVGRDLDRALDEKNQLSCSLHKYFSLTARS